ncbi:hypothetical protein AVEN_124546-1 [Araneus ventricosus]|uniref:Ras-GEF domain-containing protein n=1 Tax=Araneus ventricosus TaxID=182803 RepID=A0A4Y2JVN4_ARAVE|nr:hypothetical protein AVEN_124546-1 [Araneus ventricosus]
MADVFRYFVQVVYFCVQLRDKQSACAILSGLCNLAVLRHQALWSTLHENMPNEMSILSQILQIDWNEKKLGTVKSEIPFFRSILEVLVKELPQEFTPYTYKRRRFSEFVYEWYRWKRERKKPETLVDQLTDALSQFFPKCSWKKKNSQTELDYSSDDLFTTRYRELEGILNVIEECRKYYSFTIDSLPIDKDARYFLFNKKLQKQLA